MGVNTYSNDNSIVIIVILLKVEVISFKALLAKFKIEIATS